MIQFIKKGGGGADLSKYFVSEIKAGTQYVPGLTEMILTIPENTIVNGTNLNYAFYSYDKLTEIPLMNTSNVTTMQYTFAGCQSLKEIPLINTSNVTVMNNMCTDCYVIISFPLLDTGKVTNMGQMFRNCNNLEDVPILDTKSVTNFYNMFQYCSKLSDNSLNNIMQMCINAISYAGTKTLKQLGLSSEQATICQGLSNYTDFLEAGWTTGY